MENHPDHPEMGERTVNFSGRLFIEREDFMENPPPSSSAWLPAARRGSRARTLSGAMASRRTKAAKW
jgi:hypothetical protein